MSTAYQPFIPVKVTAAWSTVANAVTDVKTSLKDLGMTFNFQIALVLTLWEGEKDPDDGGKLSIAANGTGTWTTAFGSYPTAGQTVYILAVAS